MNRFTWKFKRIGMGLQSLMLGLTARGIGTCVQADDVSRSHPP
ncbi:hypothetical protein [Myxococcus sp. CA033]